MNTKKTARSFKRDITILNILMNDNKKMKMAGFTRLMNEDAVVQFC